MAISVDFTNEPNEVIAQGLFQWDKNQILNISGLSLPTTFQVHFANPCTNNEAIVYVGTTTNGIGVVNIPNSLLASSENKVINAWVYVTEETIRTIIMPLGIRNKPQDFLADPILQSKKH